LPHNRTRHGIILRAGQDSNLQCGFPLLDFLADPIKRQFPGHIRHTAVFSFLKIIEQGREAPPVQKLRWAEDEA
jgi:hypothetical protein